MTGNRTSRRRLTRVVVAVGASLALALLLSPAQPAQAALPPRPTVGSPAGPAPAGGAIVLCARFPEAWPWDEVHWQDLWTVVQWQDPHTGIWHDVGGWQGTPDGVEVEDGTVIGQKTWWVAEEDFGSGPFRWVVYRGQGGTRLATSEPFDLPGFNREVVQVEVSLAQ
jgi:hypothetical protein